MSRQVGVTLPPRTRDTTGPGSLAEDPSLGDAAEGLDIGGFVPAEALSLLISLYDVNNLLY